MRTRTSVSDRGYGHIVWRNIATPIFGIIIILVATLGALRQYTDALFLFSVIFFNTTIGIIQEIRAKRQIDRLALLSVPTARRLGPDDVATEVAAAELAVGDKIIVEAGEQIPADGQVVESTNFELNEALLTGEASSRTSAVGSQVYAGSVATAGHARITVSAVGDDTRVGKLSAAVKTPDRRLTPLQRSLNRTITVLTAMAVILVVIIFINGSIEASLLQDIVRTSVSAAISLVPEGLLLASSLLLAATAVRMAKRKSLIQRLASIEGFGRLRYVCLDKTGTLTGTDVEFHDFYPARGHHLADLMPALEQLLAETPTTPTAEAIIRGLAVGVPAGDAVERIAFSSARKYSAVAYDIGRTRHVAALGAPDILFPNGTLPPALAKSFATAASHGHRILALASYPSTHKPLADALNAKPTALGLIILTTKLRPGVATAVRYFQANGVHLRVISGDGLATVTAVATSAGIRDTENGITGPQLALLDDAAWDKAVAETTIFARITPEQKDRLVQSFTRLGFTAMVGDGVNDVLALRRADLGIAMAEGSRAARDVADVVLLESSYTAIPETVALSSQYIARLELIAALFFNRVVYGLVILFIVLTAGVVYPYLPRQITIMNWFVVGLPTIFWSLQPIKPRRRLSSHNFFRRVLRFAVPNGIITGVIVGVTFIVMAAGADSENAAGLAGYRTIAVIMTSLLGVVAFMMAPISLRLVGRGLVPRQLVWSAVTIVEVLLFLHLGGRMILSFFTISAPTWSTVAVIVLIVAVGASLQYLAAKYWPWTRRADRKDHLPPLDGRALDPTRSRS